MSSVPSNNPIVQQLQVVLSGYGYNFYDDRNRARSDDLLVRQRASGLLATACDSLKVLEVDFRALYIPQATRDNPYPPPDVLAKLKALSRLRDKLGDLETQIRSMAVPTQDRVWWRFRQELPLLEMLISHDYGLIRDAQNLEEFLLRISAEDWKSRDIPAEAAPAVAALQQTIRERINFLQVQAPI